ncbi:MAG TPA: hypothetical protein VN698_07000, partial [Bacteroidia bacterium]|nr:hypothetical protein [Bacteroidia bacterium]
LNKPTLFSFQNVKAKMFLKSRIFGYKFNKYEKLINKVLNRFHSNLIFSMSDFQLKMASYSISNVQKMAPLRNKRYHMLKEAVMKNPVLTLVYDNSAGLNFKIILFIESGINNFVNFLEMNKIPYFMLFTKTNQNIGLANFNKSATKFLELSCEASIPENEIERVATMLRNFKMD